MRRKIFVKFISVVVTALQLICFISYGSVINTRLSSPINSDTDNINMPPNVDFQLQKQRKVDLIFILGDTSSYTESDVTVQINAVLKPRLTDEDIIYSVYVGSSKTGTTPILTSLENMTFDSSKETYYIYIADKSLPELNTAQGQSAILSKLLSSNVNIVGLGTSANQSQFENLISKNNGCGKFISNSNISSAFSQLADYICKNCSANIVINVGDTGYDLDTVKSRVNAVLKPMLSQNGINNTITYKNEKKIEDRLIWIESNSLTSRNIYAYDPNSNTTETIGSIPYPYSFYKTCMGSDSKIYYIPYNYDGSVLRQIRVYDLNTKTDSQYALPPSYTYYFSTLYYVPRDIAINKNGVICLNCYMEYTGEAFTFTLDPKTKTWSQPGCNLTGVVAGNEIFVGKYYPSPTSASNEDLLYTNTYYIAPPSNLSGSNTCISNLVANRDGSFYYLGQFLWPSLYRYTPGVGISNGVFSDEFSSNGLAGTILNGDAGKLIVRLNTTTPYVQKKRGIYEIDTTNNSSREIISLPSLPPPTSQATYDSLDFRLFAYTHSNKLVYYGVGYTEHGVATSGSTWTSYYKNIYTYNMQTGVTKRISANFWDYIVFLNTYQPFDIYTNKSLPISDVLSSVTFKNDSTDFFVHIGDKSIDELSNNTKITQIANELKNYNVRFVGLGRSANSSQLKALADTVGSGDYFDNTNLDSALTDLGNYIIDVTMPKTKKLSNYMLDTDTIDSYSTSYSDPECDDYDNVFTITHDPSHFVKGNGSSISISNSNGYSSYNGRSVSVLPSSFIELDSLGNAISKVGSYTISYNANDKPKGDDTRFDEYRQLSNTSTQKINVCRKPIAQYTITPQGSGQNYNIKLADNGYSYSPDHTGRADKGIALRKWGIAEVSADSSEMEWNYTTTTDKTITYNVQTGKEYLVSLQVQDINSDDGYGFWSDPVVRTVKTTDIPVARFTISPNPLILTDTATVTDSSYAVSYGATITKRRWNIKKVGDISFSYANKDYCKTNYGDSGIGTYEITLEVCDSNNLWSKPYKQTLRVIENQAPTITANPTNRVWNNTNISVSLSAQDTGGSGLESIEYGWTKSSNDLSNITKISIADSPVKNSYSFNTVQDQEGIWYLFGRAKDHSGNYSNSGRFNVWGVYKCDKTDPSGIFNLKSKTDEKTVVSFTPTDKLSGVNRWRYRISLDSGSTYGDWSSYYLGDITADIILDQGGSCVIQAEVIDNAGNTAKVVSSVYEVTAIDITDISISGYWNHWRGQVDIFGERLSNEPHRFLSLERVRIDITTKGNPDKVIIRFSPELEAMTYSDPHGNVYSYGRDFFGYEVKFPTDSTFNVSNNHVRWEYNLPLAPSTKSWDNSRLRPPYTMTVTAYKGSKSVVRTINDIEITGNIYDLTYIQPVH